MCKQKKLEIAMHAKKYIVYYTSIYNGEIINANTLASMCGWLMCSSYLLFLTFNVRSSNWPA